MRFTTELTESTENLPFFYSVFSVFSVVDILRSIRFGERDLALRLDRRQQHDHDHQR